MSAGSTYSGYSLLSIVSSPKRLSRMKKHDSNTSSNPVGLSKGVDITAQLRTVPYRSPMLFGTKNGRMQKETKIDNRLTRTPTHTAC
mmetsp:Transcript_38040/g.98219  ORF Transcript_38040/g.98219 Transcript_38040/m.98219 type:complete len:87 (-) Transcript_38040:70-330(-)